MSARSMAAPATDPRRTFGRGRLASLAIMALTAAAILAVASLVNRPADAAGVTPVNVTGDATGPAPIVGKAAPDFSAPMIGGGTLKLGSLVGSPVWLTFGATWCQPCRAENPDIQAAYDAFKARGVQVVQVYMGEDATAVSDYTSRVGITYLRVPDPTEQLAAEYRILGIPSHFFIDRSGALHAIKVGTLDPETMAAMLTEISG